MEEQKQSPKSTPERLAVGTPGVPGLGEHSGLILQTVMELQRSVGGLIQGVETLTTRVEEQGKKLETISHRMYAAAAIIVLTLGAMGWVIDKAWSLIFDLVKAHIH